MRISEIFNEINNNPEVQKIPPEKREEFAEKMIQGLADKFTEILKEGEDD